MIEYREDVPAADVLSLVDRVWPGKYDQQRVIEALARTLNIGAWSGLTLVGSVRVLTDGYLFATIPEILVDPAYQRQGIGRRLMEMAVKRAPRNALFFGAQPQSVAFFERIGCVRGPAGFVMRSPRVQSVTLQSPSA